VKQAKLIAEVASDTEDNNKPVNQGRSANASGKTLESTIVPVLEGKGFKKISYSHYIKNPSKYGTELLLTRVPYTTIYGQDGHTEFKIISKKYNKEIRIECKWQQEQGSVDEKFPYFYLNCIGAAPENEFILVYGGHGFKKGSINWIKIAAERMPFTTDVNRDKKIRIFRLEEFLIWANSTFK